MGRPGSSSTISFLCYFFCRLFYKKHSQALGFGISRFKEERIVVIFVDHLTELGHSNDEITRYLSWYRSVASEILDADAKR